MNKIKVMIVDDSAVVRQVLQDVLSRDHEIEVIGAASDPLFALQREQGIGSGADDFDFVIAAQHVLQDLAHHG